MSNKYTGMEIAIIGISGRFPQSNNPSKLWESLLQGNESINFYSKEELHNQGVDPDEVDHPNYVGANAFVEDKDKFHPAFFGYSPKEAEIMSPQHRLLHEIVWECLEDAGYNPFTYKHLIGLYAGTSSTYYWESLTYISGKAAELGEFDAEHLNNKDTVCTKIAYNLNLKGPAISLHTECSTGLVAIHMAVKGILTGECNMALAGGLSLSYFTKGGYTHEEGMIRSSDGHCRAFDDKADGTMLSEGGGVVLLKRLKNAIEDGDHIYATIKGSAVNNDGFRKVGFTAPSVDGQAEVIRKAHKIARVSPQNIKFVEAHGTGTNLGDPIEVDALKLAFGDVEKNYCALGSIKTNIGHLGEGAGVAGLIKVALSLKHKVLPPSLNFETPNSKIDFDNSPFFVNSKPLQLERSNGHLLLGGVSSFGIGGTNAHIVLEEYDEERETKPAHKYELFPISSESRTAQKENLERLQEYCLKHPKVNASELAHTLKSGRKHFPIRNFVVSENYGESLDSQIEKILENPAAQSSKRLEQIVFMFPGQGNQYYDMAKGLYENVAFFKIEMDKCFEISSNKTSQKHELKSILFPSNKEVRDINDTEIAQLLLFIVEYCLAKHLMHLGIQPDILVGHSIGEYTAACLAGVFTLEDAIKIVSVRGAVMQKAPKGKMLSVAMEEEKLLQILPEGLSIAVINSKNFCVLSGEEQKIIEFSLVLEKQEIPSKLLMTSHAFHSPLMDGILAEFEESFSSITLSKPKKPFLANSKGDFVSQQEVASPKYWIQQLRESVRFHDCLNKLDEQCLIVEVGPGRSLSTFAKQSGFKNTINTLRHPIEQIDDTSFYFNTIGNIWQHGFDIDWNLVTDTNGYHKVALPTYSFAKERYWIDQDPMLLGLEAIQNKDREKKRKIDEWCYQPSWIQKHSDYSQINPKDEMDNALIFGYGQMFENGDMVTYLNSLDLKSVTVIFKKGDHIPKELPNNWICIEEEENTLEFYSEVISKLKQEQSFPKHIFHFWSVYKINKRDYSYENFIADQDSGLFNILHLAQAIRHSNSDHKVYLSIITSEQFAISGAENDAYHQTTLQAANIILPQEFHELVIKQVDFSSAREAFKSMDVLVEEALHDYSTRTIAYRNNVRWVKSYQRINLNDREDENILKENGVYLVTGGLGNVGGILSKFLSNAYNATIFTLSRSDIPERKEWDSYLEHKNDSISKKIKQIIAIESFGGNVVVLKGDVGDEKSIETVLKEAEKLYGPFNGVVHAAADTSGESHACHVDRLTKDLIEEQFYAKIKGTFVLGKYFENKSLDFFMVTSSLSAILGGIGFLAYAASNLFVDYYLEGKNKSSSTRWISINWDGWEEEDEIENIDKKQSYILPEEGGQIFHNVLGTRNQNHVVVSTRDLDTKLKKWVDLVDFGKESEEDSTESNLTVIQRPENLPDYVAPSTPVEEKLLESWQKLFGIQNIGIHDNFFELGGDSLKAVVLANRIFKELNVKISLQDFFKYTSIVSLANFIEEEEKSSYITIPKTEIKSHYQLSSAQKRFYFVYELDKTSLAYNMPVAIRLKGKVKKKRFENAFKKLINHHDNLRTSFKLVDGQPYQEISEGTEFDLKYLKISENGIDGFIGKFVRPFDLTVAPLFRAALLEISSEEHILVTDIHHIINDAESSELLVKDFLSLYNNEQLPALKLQFKDYAEWQQSEEQQKAIATQKKFWLNEFSEENVTLELPTDFSRPMVKSHIGDVVNFRITENETKELKSLAEKHEASLFMILLAAFSVLQSKLSNQEDIIIGTSTAGRDHPDLDNIIGMFVNTIPLRSYPKGNLNFIEFLGDIKLKTLTCFENQSYPYEELINELSIERSTSRNPLFDVMFAFLNIAETKLEFPGMAIEPYDLGHPVSKFDYTLQVYDNGNDMFLSFEYSTDLFKKETIDLFITYFKEIISTVIINPNIQLSEINILKLEDVKQLTEGFNDTETLFASDKTIHQIIEAKALQIPDQTAVIFENQELTYTEINEKANQLAHHFRNEFGVKRGSIVTLCAHRNDKSLIALLAILKAGGTFLPIDPNLPKSRIEYMLADAQVKLVLTNESLLSEFDTFSGKLFDLDATLDSNELNSNNPKNVNNADDPAYIIYTSGSTGKPKGVVIQHKSLVNYIEWAATYYLGEAEAIFPLYSSYSFDLTITSIFAPLVSGNKVIIYAEDENEVLIEKVFTDGVANVIKLTPSHLKIIRDSKKISPENANREIKLIVGGEDLETHLALDIHTKFSKNIEIYNEYGPTETTVGCLIYKFNPEDIFTSVPIGSPIANTKVYLLDKYLHPVAFGVMGELYISGAGLSSGYLQNEELSSEKFIPNPFVTGALMYKTDDLAIRLQNGALIFKGRKDNQVKIRGYRIELGEIESKIAEHVGISNNIVIVKEKKNQKYLVSYYVSGNEIDSETLRLYLAKSLPEYMLPTTFMYLTALPLTINGKIDTRALPDPDNKSGDTYLEPETTEEKALCEVWSKVLGLEKVGVTDKFFSLGGDSIKSIQICARLQDMGYSFSVRDILREQTIQKQSLKLKKKKHFIDQSVVEGKAGLTPIQHWFFQGSVKEKHHFNQSVMLNFPEGLEDTLVVEIIKKLQEHHDALRMVFNFDGEEPFIENKGLSLGVSLEEYDLKNKKKPEEAMLELSNNIQTSIDLENGPLIKLGLFHVQDGSRLLIVIHHLVIDAVSWRILFEDIETLYQQHLNNEKFSLPKKTTSFLSWSELLREYTKSNIFSEAQTYWEKFSARAYDTLPLDKLEKSELKNVGEASFQLNKEETSKLLTEVHLTFGTDINTVLLTGLILSLRKQFNISSALVDLESHGREQLGNETNVNRTVGWFTNFYPVLLEERKKNDIRDTIKIVKEHLNMIPNHGFDYLIEKFLISDNVDADQDRNAQISFNYLGQFDTDTENNHYLMANESTGEEISLQETQDYDLEILGLVAKNKLELNVSYSLNSFDKKTMNSFVGHYKQSLLEIVAFCAAYPKVELTPSDLTYKSLTIEQLDVLQEQYDIEDVYTLSPMQEGLLFHSLLDTESNQYFEQITYQLKGDLDISALENSLNDLMQRHDILRTLFLHEEFERPIQVVLKQRNIDFTYLDVREELIETSKEDLLKLYLEEDKQDNFNLSSSVLMRVKILQTATNEYEFIWSHHHILMDGWCMGILISEFNDFYVQNTLGESPHMAPVHPYSNYITWLEKRTKAASENFWNNYLEGYENLASIHTNKKSSLNDGKRQLKTETLTLGKDHTDLLRQVSSTNGVTINTIIQVAWAILLSKYNNNSDVAFGAVVSGRPASVEGIENMIGLFINTVPVRMTFNSEDNIKSLLLASQEKAIESEPHHYHPLSEIQAVSSLGRDLIDHILIFENYPISDEISSEETNDLGFSVTNVNIFEETNYDLFLEVYMQDDLSIEFNYNSLTYHTSHIKSILKHLKVIVDEIISDCATTIGEIDLLSEKEKNSLIGFNDTQNQFAPNETLISLFEKQAKNTPKNVAVQFEETSFTYQELSEMSNKVARYLKDQKGVKPGDLVGLMLERDEYLMPLIFGVLKTGAAYVPIDPFYPKERKHTIIEDSKLKLLVSREEYIESFENSKLEVLNLNEALININEQATQPVNAVVKDNDLAYVIYTSGSTGRPKGVMVEHRSIVNLIQDLSARFPLGTKDSYLLKTPYIFDVSTSELFGWFSQGGRLVILPKDYEKEPAKIVATMSNQQCTHVNFVPSFFNIFVDYLEQSNEDVSYLKFVFVAGEAMSGASAKKFKLLYPACQLWNLYGPTEATVYGTGYEITGDEKFNIPIGRPLSNMGVLILDRRGKLLPQGVPGELCIMGSGLARGYINNDVLKNDSFVEMNNFNGERLYKTGDLARWRSDGNLEFLGRIDHQVKLRGFRIELEEIEYQLMTHASISEAIVRVVEREEEKFLISYYISNEVISPIVLREYLLLKLPDYMAPDFYIQLDEIPLTPSGKIDRKLLPEFDNSFKRNVIVPTNEIEEVLLEIWSDVLKIDKQKISIDSSFFSLGGHSLKALNLVNKINRHYDVQITLQAFFEKETIKNLADAIITIQQIQFGTIEDDEHFEITI
jgi:amino acid adenylation domain-containing protein/non-ribosomal peptide synthase protein (TIGR01720 family)